MNNPFLSVLSQQLAKYGVDPKRPAHHFLSTPAPVPVATKPVVEAKGPPLAMYYCLYDKYYTHEENCLPPQDTWWKEATFRPKEATSCLGMSFDEALIWRSLNAGRHVCISGKAGAGKSFLIRKFIEGCSSGSFCYGVAGPTAISAYNISGETLHKKLSLGLAEEPAMTLFKKISKSKKKFAKTWKFLEETQVLIVDEISMVHPEFFQKIDYLFRKARGIDTPFGGCLIVMLGDFTQLGPVMKEEVNLMNINIKPELVIDTDTWNQMKISRLCLLRSYRQQQGDPFLDLLDHVRMGNMTKADFDMIKSRIGKKMDLQVKTEEEDDEKKTHTYRLEPIDIFPHCRSVDQRNSKKLNQLLESGEKLFSFKPYLKVQKKEAYNVLVLDHKDRMEGERLIKDENQVKKKFPIYGLNICKGCQVMMRSNSLMEIGVFNGTMGIVTNVTNQEISVVFVVGGKFMKDPIKVERAMFSCPAGKTGEVIMTQFPLSLAYSVTIHRCVSGDTLVCTEDGLTEIKTLAEEKGWNKKEVKLYTSAQECERTSQVYQSEQAELSIKIRTKMGFTLEGSPDHPVLVRTPEGHEAWKTLGSLQQDEVLVMRYGLETGSKQYLSTSSFTPPPMPRSTIHQIPEYINPMLGNMIGMLIGDGSYTRDGTIEYWSADQCLLDKFKMMTETLFDTTPRWYHYPPAVARYCIISKHIRAFFRWCGLEYTTAEFKKIPWCIMQSPPSVQLQCLKGLFDTDGGSNKTVIHFTTCSETLVKQVHQLLLNNGIISRSVIMCPRKFRIEITGHDARLYMEKIGFDVPHKAAGGARFQNMAVGRSWIKSNMGFLPDSQRIAQELRAQYSSLHTPTASKKQKLFWINICAKDCGRSNFHIRHFSTLKQYLDLTKTPIGQELLEIEKEQKFYDPVYHIEQGTCVMYDVTVPGSHTFLSNSIISHNCQGLTLDSIRLDARHCWEPGQLYTALSRVRKIDDLFLFGFNARSLLVNPKAVAFENVQLPDEFRQLEGLPTIAEEAEQKQKEFFLTGKRYRDDHVLEKEHDVDLGDGAFKGKKRRTEMQESVEEDATAGPMKGLSAEAMFDPFAEEPSSKRDFSIDTSQW